MLQLGLVKGSTNFHLIYIELRHLTYVPRIGCMSKNATRDKNRHFKAHEPGFIFIEAQTPPRVLS